MPNLQKFLARIEAHGKIVNTLCLSVFTIVIGILTYNLGVLNYNLSSEQHMQNSLLQPIQYTVEQVPSSNFYYIELENVEIKIPAMKFSIRVQTGAIKTMTALGYDGFNIYTISKLSVLPDWNKDHFIDVEIQTAPYPMVLDNIYYDYYFIYIEPMAGEPVLDLYCTAVDLENQEILFNQRYHKIDLLKLEMNESLPLYEMMLLQNYRELYQNIAQLNKNLS